jgi:hypothetical protein
MGWFKESSNRIYEKTYGHRPPASQQPTTSSSTTQQQPLSPNEINSHRIIDFTHSLGDNPIKKARGTIII